MYRTDFWTLWEKARVGWSERTASKHVYYQVWNRSPVQVGCMRQVLRAGALGRPRGMGCGGRWEGVSGWGTNVNPWLIHVNVWQKLLQYCKVISLQLIEIIGKRKKKRKQNSCLLSGWERGTGLCVSLVFYTFDQTLLLAPSSPQLSDTLRATNSWDFAGSPMLIFLLGIPNVELKKKKIST